MALRIRRGTDAQRTGKVFENGEIVWTTDGQQLWVGDGITAGGLPVVSSKQAGYGLTYNAVTKKLDVASGVISADDINNGINNKFFSSELVQDAAASLFTNGSHTNISFVYNDVDNKINATVTLDGVGITDLINDTTPQLGGDLDLNGSDITGTGNINITGTIDSTGNIETTSNVTGLTLNGTTVNAGNLKIENNGISNPSFDGSLGLDLTIDQHLNIFGKIIPPGAEPDAETTAYFNVWVSQYNSSLDPTAKVGNDSPLYAHVVNAHNGITYVESAASFFIVDGAVGTGAASVKTKYGIRLGDGIQPIGDSQVFLFESDGKFTVPRVETSVLKVGIFESSPSDNRPAGETGMIIFNNTSGKFQGFDGNNWVDLN